MTIAPLQSAMPASHAQPSLLLVHVATLAHEAPKRLAVQTEESFLDYATLEHLSSILAHHLKRQYNIGPEQVVAVRMRRSPLFVTVLLAIFKAGGAYAPIDPAYPPSRQNYILQDSGARLCITDEFPPSAPSSDTIPHIAASQLLAMAKKEPISRELAEFIAPIPANRLAYIIYTSGSTGKPKGVEIEHGSLANLIAWHHAQYGSDLAEIRSALLSSPSFDASVWEIWPFLSAGATLTIPDEQRIVSPPDLIRWIQEWHIAHLFLTTPLAELFLAETFPENFPLQYLITGGDRLTRLPQDQLPFVLRNQYGPTENTVFSTCYTVPSGHTTPPPIGRPIRNVSFAILDEQLQPVPPGASGELFLGGANLARGYRNQPQLTAEKFPILSLPDAPPLRYYRTGDRVRLLADGNIEFIGRLDNQIKLRGFRIELGEIETVLNQCPEVRSGVVVVREAGGMVGRQLVAYYQPQAPSHDQEKVRDFLAQHLPTYMLPILVPMPRLPLTINGKVDRAALPPPPSPGATGPPPVSPLEKTTAEAWKAVLDISRVSRTDNFFALGGHSLNAAKVTALLQRHLHRNIPVSLLFHYPVLADFAAALASCTEATGDAQVLPRDTQKSRLSPGQRLLWTQQQMHPQATAYNLVFAYRLHGTVDVQRLRQALQHIVHRHPALHTIFLVEDGEIWQKRAPDTPFVLEEHTIAGKGWQESYPTLLKKIHQLAASPFDLLAGTPVRFVLFLIGDQDMVLFFCVHHIIFDGWSIQILLQELATIYEDLESAKPPRLLPAPPSMLDFAAWQNEQLQSGSVRAQIEFWRSRLDTPPILELALDQPRPPQKTFQGASRFLTLEQGLVARLEALAVREGSTLTLVFLTAYALLLARYAGQKDLVIGVASAGRVNEEQEQIIGYLANVLPLRLKLSPQDSFRQCCTAAKKELMAALDHQDIPFGVLLEELTITTQADRTPVFQALFSFVDYRNIPEHIDRASISSLPVSATGAKTDLTLLIHHLPTELRLEIEFSTDVFSQSAADRLLGNYQALLEGVTETPDASISSLPILCSAERLLLTHWNDTQHPYPTDVFVHELIAQTAAHHPQKIAVRDAQSVLTYGELDSRANQLAHYLHHKGIAAGSIVAVSLQREVSMLVALLGILKAGCAYVPVDPELPAARTAMLLHDAQAAALVTNASPSSGLPQVEIPLICLQNDWSSIAEQPISPLPCHGDPQNTLMYVVYTSGSTGRPKGVMVPHAALVNVLLYMRDLMDLGPQDRFLAVSNLSFDMSKPDLFGALIYGAEVYLATKEEFLDGKRLLSLIGERSITFMQATPSFLRIFEEFNWKGSPRMTIVSGGEPLPADLARFLAARIKALWNGYGPTEATVYTTFYQVQGTESGLIPIGSPIANAALHVLDPQGQPLPIGVAGELYITGRGISKGYLRQPELTSRCFLSSPEGMGGGQMYKTGDIVRFRQDGKLEYVGRCDDQVKIRGFRIELGEIEAVLNQCPGVRAGVVMARSEATNQEKRLIGYVVLEPGYALHQVSSYLAERLPPYMVPPVIVPMTHFPLTTTGKVDRKALPFPPAANAQAAARQAPVTAMEKLLAEIWREVLGVDHITREDSFFSSLGGSSLQAVRVLSLLLKRYGMDIRINTMFTAKNLADFAKQIERERTRQGAAPRHESVLLPIQTKGELPPLFFVHPVGGTAYCYAHLAEPLGEDRPLYGIQSIGIDGRTPVPESVEEMASCYLQELRSVQPSGPYLLAGWSFGGLIAFEMGRQLHDLGEQVSFLAVIDALAIGATQKTAGRAKRREREGGPSEKFFSAKKKILNTYKRLTQTAADNLKCKRIEQRLADGDLISYEDRFWYITYKNRVASRYYIPKPYKGDIFLFLSEDDKIKKIYKNRTDHWQSFVEGTVHSANIDADHINIIRAPEFIVAFKRAIDT